MKYETIREENIKLYLPSQRDMKKSDVVFYNPEAKLSRDLTLLLAKQICPRVVYDMHAGTGAMGLRIASSCNLEKIVFVDANPNAIELVKKNVELNKIKNVDVIEGFAEDVNTEDAELILIDPFGSPASVYKKVIEQAKEGCVIALKATDMGTISGRYPKKAKKIYNIELKRNYCPRESSIRLLITFAYNEAIKQNKLIKPIFSYATNYYTHVFVKVIKENEQEIKINKNQIWQYTKSDLSFLKKVEQKYWKLFADKKRLFDLKEVKKVLDKVKNNYWFEYVYHIPSVCKSLSVPMKQREEYLNFGVFLSFDEDTITTWLKKDELIRKLKD